MNEKDKEVLDLSAPVTVELLNAVSCFHPNRAVQAVALMGAGAALSKDGGFVSREQYIAMCARIWDTQTAMFQTVEVKAN